jgi:hypothetical protein
MRGTITLIEDELYRTPRRDWQRKIEQLDAREVQLRTMRGVNFRLIIDPNATMLPTITPPDDVTNEQTQRQSEP